MMDQNNTNMNMDMMMRTTFFFGRTIPGGLLFQQWFVDSTGTLVGAVIAVFLLAVFYEGLKSLREYLVSVDYKYNRSHSGVYTFKTRNNDFGTCTTETRNNDLDDDSGRGELLNNTFSKARPKNFKYYSISVSMHLIQSVLHVVQVGYAYILMLVAMTFNGWLFLAICFGAGVGYLVFAKSRHLSGNFREQNEHCH